MSKRKKKTIPFDDQSLGEQVTLAMPIAQRLIAEGVEVLSAGPNPNDPELEATITELTGIDMLAAANGIPDEALGPYATNLRGAMALGIAFGLLVRPEAFGVGGAR